MTSPAEQLKRNNMPLPVAALERVLQARGYITLNETTKKTALRKEDQRPVYLNKTSKTGTSALIVHPALAAHALAERAPGTLVAQSYYHSSNMRLFPTRVHHGENAIPFGWSITFDSETAANAFLDELERTSSKA
jgi:hypothetical protein